MCDEDLIEFNDYIIWTDFYITIPESIDFIVLTERNERNYDDYELFCLNTNITNWITNKWNDKIYLTFPSKKHTKYKNRYYLTIRPMIGNKILRLNEHQIDKLQTKVNNINKYNMKSTLLISNHTKILSYDNELIPHEWIREMLPYLNINKELSPYINKQGLYVRLGYIPDYIEIYTKLATNIENEIKRMYNYGYVFSPSNEIIQKWYLVSIDSYKEVYYPIWTDIRLTRYVGNKTEFILDRMNGIKTIDYHIGNNNIIKHNIAKEFSDTMIIGEYARIYVDNIVDAQKIASKIDYIKYTSNGHVILKYVRNKDDINIYKDIWNKNRHSSISISSYKTNYTLRPYAVSFLYDYNTKFNRNKVSMQLFSEYNNKLLNMDRIIINDVNINTLNISQLRKLDTEITKNIDYPENIQFSPEVFNLTPEPITELTRSQADELLQSLDQERTITENDIIEDLEDSIDSIPSYAEIISPTVQPVYKAGKSEIESESMEYTNPINEYTIPISIEPINMNIVANKKEEPPLFDASTFDFRKMIQP